MNFLKKEVSWTILFVLSPDHFSSPRAETVATRKQFYPLKILKYFLADKKWEILKASLHKQIILLSIISDCGSMESLSTILGQHINFDE